MDGSSKILTISQSSDALGDYDKMLQAYELLTRNPDFLHDIEKVREQYSIGQYPFEGETAEQEYDEYPEDEAERKRFFNDVRNIAAKIRFPGEWERPVRRLVIRYEPEVALLPDPERKEIVATVKSDHVELKLYGDLTVPDLRGALDKIRKLIAGNQNSAKTNYSVRYKPRLNKNLLVFDMANRGKTYIEIANYCKKHGIQHGMQQADVSKYIELAQKQIAKIYA